VLVEGLEWIVPGHEHTDVAVITGQHPHRGDGGNADNMAQFEFASTAADNDAIGPVDTNNVPIWTGKDNVIQRYGRPPEGCLRRSWLQANFPLQAYAIPTHSERAGPFDPAASHGTTSSISATSTTPGPPWHSVSSRRDISRRVDQRRSGS